MSSSVPAVFPRPREMTLAGGRGVAHETAVYHDPGLPPQGYELVVTDSGTRIGYADEAGLRYARLTLAQLSAIDELPGGRIRDWPDFTTRGFMLDISRDRVPTMATLEWLIGTLAELRYNHLQLYTEHTFAYAGHEAVWGDASPTTAAELRQIDAWCQAAGIELAANQNTFGHMTRWLLKPEHRDRAECPDGSVHPLVQVYREPWSLAPTADNAEFALGLVREMAANVESRRVNINCDEPFDLGLGRSRDLVDQHGRAPVFLDHLHRLVDPLVTDGHDVLFWADALVRHPELMPQLPKGGTAVVWNYEAPRPDGPTAAETIGEGLAEFLGLPDQAHLGFSAFVRPYAEAGYPHWVAPGTSSWSSLVGRWSNARRNLLDAAEVGRSTGAAGYLVTDWGDNGHLQPLAVSVLSLVYGAGVAWSREANAEADPAPTVDRLLDAEPGVGARLAELGNVYARLRMPAMNGSALLFGMVKGTRLPLQGELGVTPANEVEELLAAAVEQFAACPFGGERGAPVGAEMYATSRLARHGLWRLRQTRGDGRVDTSRLERDFDECLELQREAWLLSSRPGGLDDSLGHLLRPPPDPEPNLVGRGSFRPARS